MSGWEIPKLTYREAPEGFCLGGISAAFTELLWGWLGAPRVGCSGVVGVGHGTIPSPFGSAQQESTDFGWPGHSVTLSQDGELEMLLCETLEHHCSYCPGFGLHDPCGALQLRKVVCHSISQPWLCGDVLEPELRNWDSGYFLKAEAVPYLHSAISLGVGCELQVTLWTQLQPWNGVVVLGFILSLLILLGIKRKRRRIKTRRGAETRGSGQRARKRRAKTRRRIETGNPRATRM